MPPALFLALLGSLLVAHCWCFAFVRHGLAVRKPVLHQSGAALFAKNKKSPKNKANNKININNDKNKSTSLGGETKAAAISSPTKTAAKDNKSSQSQPDKPEFRIDSQNDYVLPATSIDEVFSRYGMKDSKNQQGSSKSKATKSLDDPNRAFGEGVLENIPEKVQLRIDQFLVLSTFLSLGFVILCGVGISLGAFKVVFPDIAIPEGVDSFTTKVLNPSFTPALGLFFFFSITYGVFKFAQASSASTVYKED